MDLRDPKLQWDKIGITEYSAGNNKTVLKLFDITTGEIFEDSSYVVKPVKVVNPLPREAMSAEQALDYRSDYDRQYMSVENKYFSGGDDLIKAYGLDTYKIFLKLTKHVVVHNSAYIKRDSLIELIGCTNKNLNRKLNLLQENRLIQYTTKGLYEPTMIKILLNPSYFWWGSNHSRFNEWLTYWCARDETVARIEDDFRKAMQAALDCDVDISVDDCDYSIAYDIGVYDDRKDMFGNVSTAIPYVDTEELTHDKLLYIIYGV